MPPGAVFWNAGVVIVEGLHFTRITRQRPLWTAEARLRFSYAQRLSIAVGRSSVQPKRSRASAVQKSLRRYRFLPQRA